MENSTSNLFGEIQVCFSTARFKTYLDERNNNHEEAIELYRINIQLCEALYPIFHVFEIALRNSIDKVLSDKFEDDWLRNNKITFQEEEQSTIDNAIQKSIQKIVKNDKQVTRDNVSKDIIITNLSLGFWTMLMISKKYTIGQSCCKSIFPYPLFAERSERNIQYIRALLPKINYLRNIIFHHEPIFKKYGLLYEDYQSIKKMIRWINPTTALWVENFDRFPEVYEQNRIFISLKKKPAQ